MEEIKKEISAMLGNCKEFVLGDGARHKFAPLTILDLTYFEEVFGSIQALYEPQKQFTKILHLIYRSMLKNEPKIKFEDLDRLFPLEFINQNANIMGDISQWLVGSLHGGKSNEATDSKNVPTPIVP